MIAVVGDRETMIGFRMAGIKHCYEADENGVKGLIESLACKKIIIINERLYKVLGAEFPGKIFIRVPDKKGSSGSDDIRKIIREIAGRDLDI
ncbi:MAG: V-type ATP synthase subunit F [Candidatus Aenigmarchaeota archaeon]|nr:V-type ATP synthase subunit F [Candidatus Aenigmarchaeota archaeon]